MEEENCDSSSSSSSDGETSNEQAAKRIQDRLAKKRRDEDDGGDEDGFQRQREVNAWSNCGANGDEDDVEMAIENRKKASKGGFLRRVEMEVESFDMEESIPEDSGSSDYDFGCDDDLDFDEDFLIDFGDTGPHTSIKCEQESVASYVPPPAAASLSPESKKAKFKPPPSLVTPGGRSNSSSNNNKHFQPPPSITEITDQKKHPDGRTSEGTMSPAKPNRPPHSDSNDNLGQATTFDSKYNRGTKLGKGAFAEVFIGIEKRTRNEYAVKQIDRSKMQWSGRDALMDEIDNLKKLKEAPYVVKFQDCFLEEPNLCFLILELLPGGELFERIIQKGNFTEGEARDSCRCILSALSYMHGRRMAHRDLKPENLLLSDTIDIGPIKLSDFGFSKTLSKRNECRTLCGTPGYLAPEILERWPAYDVKCDTFSFGVILFLLLGGYLPFDAHVSVDIKQGFERTRNGKYYFFPQRWSRISSQAKDLVAKCLCAHPSNRIDAKSALDHEWMTEAESKLPKTQISAVSLAETFGRMQKARDAKRRRQRRQKEIQEKDTAGTNRLDELRDDFTVYMEERKADSIESYMTEANKTVFQEDSHTGKPFSAFYRRGDDLGKGGFAIVYRATHKRTSVQYAAKEIDTSKLGKQAAATLEEEIVALKYLRGAPYIIQLYDVFETPGKIFLVLEELNSGTILELIGRKEVYTELEATRLCRAILYAVDYCHKKCIAHRNIKLENIMLVGGGEDSSVKLADFGFAKKCTKKGGLKTLCGTPSYMAPEIFDLSIEEYDHRCDMWSVGVVVYFVLGGYLPFEGGLKQLQNSVIHGEYTFHSEWWGEVSIQAKDFIRNLLHTSPELRYSAEQAIGALWMHMDDAELGFKDRSVAQSKIKNMATSSKKSNILSNSLISAKRFTAAAANATFGAIPVGVSSMESIKVDASEGISIAPFEEEMSEDLDEKGVELERFYGLDEKIVEGVFEDFRLATHKNTQVEYAVKQVVRRLLHPSDAAALNDEIAILRSVKDCPHVVRLHQTFENADDTCLVMEYFRGQALVDCLFEYTELHAKELIRNLLQGVAFCHQKRIALRNLRLENLILPLGSKTDVKISNFGNAKKVLAPNSLHTQCGTQEYVAPEVLENRPAYDIPCDIWTVGVIVFIMLGGYYPFRGDKEDDVLEKVRYGEFRFHKKYWSSISDEAKSLVKSMMTVYPDERVTAEMALSSSWIKTDLFPHTQKTKVCPFHVYREMFPNHIPNQRMAIKNSEVQLFPIDVEAGNIRRFDLEPTIVQSNQSSWIAPHCKQKKLFWALLCFVSTVGIIVALVVVFAA